MLAVTLEQFQKCRLVAGIVVVVSEDSIDYCTREIVKRYELTKVAQVAAGGKSRQESVRNGIEVVSNSTKKIVIHDAARPLVTIELIERIIKESKNHRGVVPGMPVKDTVKEIDNRGQVVKTVDRQTLWTIQTPQIFRYEDIRLAHKKAMEEDWKGITDDASLIEKLNIPVTVIPGEGTNIKVTTGEDLELARLLLRASREP